MHCQCDVYSWYILRNVVASKFFVNLFLFSEVSVVLYKTENTLYSASDAGAEIKSSAKGVLWG